MLSPRFLLKRTVRKSILLGMVIGAFLAVGMWPTIASATSFTNVYVFGASYVDSGNRFNIDGIPASPPYFNGRFSNGPNVADRIGQALGHPTNPSSNWGTNFAVGGHSGNEILGQTQQLIGQGTPLDPTALYLLYVGGNDLEFAFLNQGMVNQIIANALSDIQAALGLLSNNGAKNFLLFNNHDISRLPNSLATPGKAAFMSTHAPTFNTGLDAIYNTLVVNPMLGVTTFDTFSFSNNILDNPATFGFTNITDACLNPNTQMACSNPDDYVFWDGRHPTARWHGLVSRSALTTLGETPVPEPSTMLLLGSGLVGLIGYRWRRNTDVRPCPAVDPTTNK